MTPAPADPFADPIDQFSTPLPSEDRRFFGGEDYNPVEDKDEDESEASMIARFDKMVEVPDFLKQDYDRFDADRKYVNTDCMFLDDEDAVATNYILRYQHTLISQIYAKNPAIAVKPKPWIGPYPPGLFEFAQTIEIAVQRFSEEATFSTTLTGMLQDVQTTGIAWMKLSVQQDFARDPIGARRHNDQMDNIARLRTLLNAYQAGEIDEYCAEYKELTDLSDTVKVYLQSQVQDDIAQNPPPQIPGAGTDGMPMMMPDPSDPRMQQQQALNQPGMLSTGVLPEVPYFLGFNMEPVMPEDIRFDWDITRPEDFYFGKWVAHRVYMAKREIADKWGDKLEDDDWSGVKVFGYGKNGRQELVNEDPAGRSDVESSQINARCAVWELHDREAGRIYTWVQGMKKFVSNILPEVTWHRFFPFFPLLFNRVTGKFIPISDARLQMPLQDEINLKRTHEREAQKACYPRLIITQGLLTPGEKEKLENALPYAVIEMQKADDVAKSLHELNVGNFDPQLYSIDRAVRELEIIAGISQSASGTPGGADSATEAAIANQQMGVQSDHRKNTVVGFIKEVFAAMTEMSLIVMPEENIRQMVGPGAVWPILNREQLWRLLNLDIDAGASGKPDQKKELEMWTQFVGLCASLGVIPNGPEVLKKILEVMGMPVDIPRFTIDPLIAAQMGMMPPAPGGMPPAPGGQAGPGAPPMADRGVPSPGGLPNGPSGGKNMAPKPQGGDQRSMSPQHAMN